MEENNKFKFDKSKINSVETEEEVDYSQVEDKSKISAVYSGMSFAGDIQPLEDIKVNEEIKVDFENLNKENKELIKQQNNTKRNINKKISLGFKEFIYKSWKKALIAIIIIAVLTGGCFGAYFIGGNIIKNKPVAKSVYINANNETVVQTEDGNTFSLGEKVKDVKVASDGTYLYYSVDTFSKTGKFDLYFVNLKSKKSIKRHGKLLDNGIDEDWKMTKDGRFVCFGKNESGEITYKMFSAEDEKKVEVSDSVAEVYMPSNGDVVYFTRTSGDVTSLHRMRYGEKSENVINNYTDIKFFDSDNGFEFLFTLPAKNGFDLYSLSGYGEPVKICSEIDEIEMGNYSYSGNLYYYKRNTFNVDWQDYISDKYFDTDLNMKEPAESEFMKQKGFIFKRYVLDRNAYDAALKEYNAKLLRDSIRAQLDDIDFGVDAKDEYTVYAYYNGSSVKLANGVALDDVVSCSQFGIPRIIYRTSSVDIKDKIPMDKLVELTDGNDASEALDLVRTKVSDSYEINDTCEYSWFNGTKNVSYNINDYSSTSATFTFGSTNSVYALSNGNLYVNSVNANGISAKKSIDTKVIDCKSKGENIYYLKDEGKSDTLYVILKDGSKKKICNNEYSYDAISDNYVIVHSKIDDEANSVGIFDGKAYKSVDTNIYYNSFIQNGQSFAYLKDFQNKGGTLYTYSSSEGTVKRAENVSKVLFVK